MKKVIIVGATSGIGHELAIRYINKGYTVGVAGRRTDELDKLVHLAEERVFPQYIDVTSSNATSQLSSLIDKLNGIDLFILCSGIGYQNLTLDADIEIKTAATNVEGFTRMVTTAFNYFKHKENGHIAIISSIAGTKGLGCAPAYSATKRFQNIYIEALEQLAFIYKLNIKFTDIRPGFVATPLLGKTKYPYMMNVGYVADKIIDSIAKKKKTAIIDWRYSVIVFFWRLIPRSVWTKLKITNS